MVEQVEREGTKVPDVKLEDEDALAFARWLTGGVSGGLVPDAVEHWAIAIALRDEAQREAGWNAHRTCVRGPAHTHPDDTDRCPLAPNVFERIEQGAWREPPLAEEPPSLLALVREDLDDRREGRAWARIAEAIDSLTARVGTVEVSVEDVTDAHRRTESRSFRANERLDALEEWRMNVIVPAAPEPGEPRCLTCGTIERNELHRIGGDTREAGAHVFFPAEPPVWREPPLAEEPPSLLALVREDLDDRREGRAWARIAEAIDSLTARALESEWRLAAAETRLELLTAVEEWEIGGPGRTIYGHGITPKEAEELMAPYEGARGAWQDMDNRLSALEAWRENWVGALEPEDVEREDEAKCGVTLLHWSCDESHPHHEMHRNNAEGVQWRNLDLPPYVEPGPIEDLPA